MLMLSWIHCVSMIGLLMRICIPILAVFLSEVSSTKAYRPISAEKSYAVAKCNASEVFPSSIYYIPDEENGHWCCECPPGYYVSEDCEDKHPLKTVCVLCPDGHFTSEANHNKSCSKFSMCNHLPNTRLVVGNSTEDNKCLCIDGTFSPDPSIAGCKRHNRCPKGFGVQKAGTSWQDVICELCSNGMCSNEESSTQKCSRCMNTSLLTRPVGSSLGNTTDGSDIKTSSKFSEPSTGYSAAHLVLLCFVGFVACAILIGAICCCRRYGNCCREQIRGHTVEDGGQGNNQQNGGVDMQNLNGVSGSEGSAGQESEDDASGGHGVSKKDSQRRLIPNGKDKKAENQNRGNLRVGVHEPKSEEVPLLSEDKAFEGESEAPGLKEEDQEVPGAVVDEVEEAALPLDESGVKEKDQEVPYDVVVEVEEVAPPLDESAPHDTQEVSLKDRTGGLKSSEIVEKFRNKGYCVSHDPEKDGDCQFSSIAYQLQPDLADAELQQKAREIRLKTAEWMEQHPEDYEGFDFRYNSLKDYISALRKNEFGDETTLQAACEVYKISIKVIPTEKQEVVKRPLRSSSSQCILLGYVDGGEHYVCLQPIEDEMPGATAPTSDSRVVSDSCSPSINPPAQLNDQSLSSESGGAMEDTDSGGSPSAIANPPQLNIQSPSGEQTTRPSSDHAEPQPEPTPSGISPQRVDVFEEPRELPHTRMDNEQSPDLRLFKHEQDRRAIRRVPSHVLSNSLKSEEIRSDMLRGPHGLHSKINASDLKFFIRHHKLLDDIDIEDLEKDYGSQQSELRIQLLRRTCENKGRQLTPGKLLEISLGYKPQKIYDVLCKAFIEKINEDV